MLCRIRSLAITGVALLFSIANSQPTLTPPVAIGPQELSGFGGSVGFHEFLTQPSSPDGDIGGIVAGETYWVYVTGIDPSGVDGPDGRRIQFNLQDFESGSSFKHLGISFAIADPDAASTDFLRCYQADGDDGLSTHSLGVDGLTGKILSLRFQFTKAADGEGWDITPYFRLDDGEWTLFFDEDFTTTEPFTFLGAKLRVGFNDGADGTLTFDNFFVVGPINPPLTNVYVDDDWNGLADGEIVQFPGQFNVQVIGENAFDTIQEGVGAAADDGTVNVAAGEYLENVTVDAVRQIVGVGSGSDPDSNTVVSSGTPSVSVFTIDGTSSGPSKVDRFTMKNMRIRNAAGADFVTGSGILVVTDTQAQYMTFDNIVTVQNGCGIAFADNSVEPVALPSAGSNRARGETIKGDPGSSFNDIVITNSVLSNNENSGIFIDPNISTFDSLTVNNCDVMGNGFYGLTLGQFDAFGISNVFIDSTDFNGNGNFFVEDVRPAALESEAVAQITDGTDIHMVDFNGNLEITNSTITGNGEFFGIKLFGSSAAESLGPKVAGSPIGNVTFSNVTIDGFFSEFSMTNGAAQNGQLQTKSVGQSFSLGGGLLIGDYSDLNGLSFSGITLDTQPLGGEESTNNLTFLDCFGSFDIGNTALGGNATFDIFNFATLMVDATGATFTAAADDSEIEDRIIHAVDASGFGLVTWVTGNLFMTPNSFLPPDTSASIARVIQAAADDDTVNISADHFWDDPQILVEENVVIRGAGKTSTFLHPEGPTSDTGDDRAWFLVSSGADVTFMDLTLDGTGVLIFEAIRFKGQGEVKSVCFNEIKYNETGPELGGFGVYAISDGPVDVLSCTFTEMGRTGAYYSGNPADGSRFDDNTYTGKGVGGWLDYAVEMKGGVNVEISNNIISACLGIIVPSSSASVSTGKGGDYRPRSLSGDICSSGILVVDEFSDETNADIHNNEISNSTHAVQIGVGPDEECFVELTSNQFFGCEFAVLAFSANFIGIEDCKIYDNISGLYLQNVNVYDLDLSQLYGNTDAIYLVSAFGELGNDNIIHDNDRGVVVSDAASAASTIGGNEFCNNTSFAVENLSGTPVDAANNWWGAFNGPGGAGSGDGDAVSANVTFTSFRTASSLPDSPCFDDAACAHNGDVNDSGTLTPGDALCAFSIFLNGQTVPASCNELDSACELFAADVDCNLQVTPGDALDIFQRFLDGNEPLDCFAAVPAAGAPVVNEMRLSQHRIVSADAGSKDAVVVTLDVDELKSLQSFGFELLFPADEVTFEGLERGAALRNWTEVRALELEPGHLRLGGFNGREPVAASDDAILRLHFRARSSDEDQLEMQVVEMVDNIADATVKIIDNGTSDLATVPDAFALYENYPNPFNPETVIRFDLPSQLADGARTTLAIYNVAGQRVRLLLDEVRSAGAHSIQWDGKNDAGIQLPSGAYFYTIRAGEFTKTRKMLLLR